jgi:hypothetical protein
MEEFALKTSELCEAKGRGILTFAFGKAKYVEMAKSLARSLLLHSPREKRAVVTDSNDPELRLLFDDVIPYRPEFGKNVRQKIYIDQYSPYDETLFIDGDSLVVGELEPFWSAFAGQSFGVPGHRWLRKGDGDEYMEVDHVLHSLGLREVPKFNGGTYYFDRSAEAEVFFQTAREVLARSAELRLKDFRGDGPCDEAVYAVAMALHGMSMTDMGAGGMWTPIGATTEVVVDVGRGVCRFTKRDRPVAPEVMHFATWTDHYVYRRECLRLERIAADGYRVGKKSELSRMDLARVRAVTVGLRLRKAYFGALRRMKERRTEVPGRLRVLAE